MSPQIVVSWLNTNTMFFVLCHTMLLGCAELVTQIFSHRFAQLGLGLRNGGGAIFVCKLRSETRKEILHSMPLNCHFTTPFYYLRLYYALHKCFFEMKLNLLPSSYFVLSSSVSHSFQVGSQFGFIYSSASIKSKFYELGPRLWNHCLTRWVTCTCEPKREHSLHD